MDDLQHIIKQKRELLSRDTFSRAAFDSSEGMSENQKDRYISYLVDRVNEMDLDKRAMELVLEVFLKAKKEMQEELSVMKKRQEQLDSKLDTETKKRKKAEQRVEKLENQLAFARKNQFGDKRQKVKNANEDESNGENPDRNDEQEKFDGTDDTLETKSVPEPSDAPVSKKETKRDLCNRPDTYNAMGLQGDPVEHPSDDSKIPGRILDRKMVKVFHFETRLVEFNVCFGGLYGLEHQYDKEGLIPDERYRRRQGLETKEIQITLRQHLSIQLEKLKTEPENVSSYLKEAVNYLEKFWDEIFAYLKDGNYPIDNNIAERSIRKLTTQRNSMLHFGSDEGVEMAATYHSVISTVKMHGKSAWEFLGKFFTNIFNGCRDYLSLSPKNIGLALCQ